MAAIIEACQSDSLNADVEVVISTLASSPALERASEYGVNVRVVQVKIDGDESTYGKRLLEELQDCDWICLGGYMRLLPKEILARFPNRVLNIHPSLLPKFGGKGMYGHFVHEAVVAAGETESGCTVHYVNEHYDEGAILLQKSCPVLPTDSPDDLAARVLNLEHLAYVEALRQVLS